MQFIKLSQTGLTVSGLTVSGLCLGTGTFGKQTDELESFRIFEKAADADVTPLDHTILSGGHPRAEAPLMLGNEGAGVIVTDPDVQIPRIQFFTREFCSRWRNGAMTLASPGSRWEAA